MATVGIIEVIRDEGSVVVFRAVDEDGDEVLIGVDHRCAQAITAALEASEDVEVDVEPWQILGTVPA